MTENAKSFLEAVSRDKAFLEKIDGNVTPEALIALAAEKGFTLTAEDLKPDAPAGELSDEELDGVAGGTSQTFPMEGLRYLMNMFR